MTETSVGVRELKSRLSEYLRRVRAGDSIVITDHGRPVGRIVPAGQSRAARLQAMLDAGALAWSGQKLEPMAPVAQVQGEQSVAELLIEERG